MACECFSKVGPYLDKEMPAAQRQEFESHLKSCSECKQELSRLQRLSTFISVAAAPAVNPQQLFWKARNNRQGLIRFAEMLTAAAAVIILVCGIWLLKSNAPTNAATANWQRAVVTQQFEAPQNESDDPFVQVLLREQP